MAEKGSRREMVLSAARDAGIDFSVYDRKEDEWLDGASLASAIEKGEVTKDEIVAAFWKGVEDGL